jgi:hypothetical protein
MKTSMMNFKMWQSKGKKLKVRMQLQRDKALEILHKYKL